MSASLPETAGAGAASPHVIVVGAGPAGAVLSHLLASRGVQVTLIERQRDFAREFRGEVLMPSGITVLDSLGIDAALEKVPRLVPSAFELYGVRGLIFRVEIDPAAFDGPPPTIVSQPALLEALVAESQRTTSLRFLRGATVRELLRRDGRVCGVRVRAEDGEQRLSADLVIGCDGRSSSVRRSAGLEAESQELPMDVVWGKVPAPASYRGQCVARAQLARGHLFISYVNTEGLLQLAWVILKGTFGELRRQGAEQWVAEMAEHAPADLSAHLRDEAASLQHPFLLSTQSDRLPEWSIPGALVLGDAAHAMSPVGGQGLNIALRDAVVAANHLVPALRQGASAEAIDRITARIAAERLPEVVAIQRLQAFPPRVILPRTWWAEALRQLPRLLRFAPLRGIAARGAGPFLNGTTEVALRV